MTLTCTLIRYLNLPFVFVFAFVIVHICNVFIFVGGNRDTHQNVSFINTSSSKLLEIGNRTVQTLADNDLEYNFCWWSLSTIVHLLTSIVVGIFENVPTQIRCPNPNLLRTRCPCVLCILCDTTGRRRHLRRQLSPRPPHSHSLVVSMPSN